MMMHRFLKREGVGLLAIGILTAACASSNVMNVQYQLPALAGGPIPRSVVIVFEDDRKSSAFLTRSAREELEGFSDVYALTVSRPGRGSELKGAYALGPLFTEILRYRLEDSGVKVVPSGANADAELNLVLKEFQLDFGDRKWSASVAYETRLLKNGTLLSMQAVKGNAERVMFMKKADAEKVIGELVSDAINQMDLTGLFKRAGL
ncbi:MAG: hypothetical protein MUC33_01455 [Desulfobacterales bacterium]|mgnify:CR=1 FL=1|jgi:hypothetical protein|nr:hypothetical protein [Desulfobacterales bacterium]